MRLWNRGALEAGLDGLSPTRQSGSVLVVGAGIAGLTAASLLGRAGFRVVVVERTDALSGGGFLVSLSEAAYRTADRIGAMAFLTDRVHRIARSSYHNAKGRALLRLEYDALFGSLQVVQPSRDQLAEALGEALPPDVRIRRGVSPIALDQDPDGVTVALDDGSTERVDAVIGADGVHSAVRRLVFDAGAVRTYPLGLCCAAFRLPNTLGLDREFRTYMERDRYMAVYSKSEADIGAVFVWSDEKRSVPVDSSDRADMLRRAFDGSAPQTRQVLEHVPSHSPFYMDTLQQIELAQWHVGRICLVGDAAHCLTLFSGRGAAAALVGAADVAERLIADPRHPERAFAEYGDALKPKLDAMQAATRDAVKWYVPRNGAIAAARNGAMRFLPRAIFEAYFRRKYSNV